MPKRDSDFLKLVEMAEMYIYMAVLMYTGCLRTKNTDLVGSKDVNLALMNG